MIQLLFHQLFINATKQLFGSYKKLIHAYLVNLYTCLRYLFKQFVISLDIFYRRFSGPTVKSSSLDCYLLIKILNPNIQGCIFTDLLEALNRIIFDNSGLLILLTIENIISLTMAESDQKHPIFWNIFIMVGIKVGVCRRL